LCNQDEIDTSSLPVEKEGWLMQQEKDDTQMISWKRRWTIVKANKMYFYAEKGVCAIFTCVFRRKKKVNVKNNSLSNI
jgi:hypothetical protein